MQEPRVKKFEEMLTGVERISLADNLKYAMSLQFMERPEDCGNIIAIETIKLKDVIEDLKY